MIEPKKYRVELDANGALTLLSYEVRAKSWQNLPEQCFVRSRTPELFYKNVAWKLFSLNKEGQSFEYQDVSINTIPNSGKILMNDVFETLLVIYPEDGEKRIANGVTAAFNKLYGTENLKHSTMVEHYKRNR